MKQKKELNKGVVMLSCSCDFDDEYWFSINTEFSTMDKLSRRKRCYSCNKLINPGDNVIKLYHYRYPKTEIEEKICGDEINLSNKFFCEECGEIYLNLNATGLCFPIGEDLHNVLREYWEMTGFNPDKYKEAV